MVLRYGGSLCSLIVVISLREIILECFVMTFIIASTSTTTGNKCILGERRTSGNPFSTALPWSYQRRCTPPHGTWFGKLGPLGAAAPQGEAWGAPPPAFHGSVRITALQANYMVIQIDYPDSAEVRWTRTPDTTSGLWSMIAELLRRAINETTLQYCLSSLPKAFDKKKKLPETGGSKIGGRHSSAYATKLQVRFGGMYRELSAQTRSYSRFLDELSVFILTSLWGKS